MLLKSLELQGFKTFPDKTVLSFGDGITAVVGPNGSGKSNISDAVRWVLGEQSAKVLRCSKMEDVIFSGTPTRKAQGFAEVTLFIDNSDRRLPFDADEVSVSHRYFRSGESEYLINKATVRLKDIHELFMDTGLGRDGYSMISQGKIDSIVASRSEDRREIFEEAAGISRYRYRKLEAEKRLSQAEDNLLRLKDILSELEERIGPLAEQSEKAERFLEFSQEKRTLEIGLWLYTLEKSGQVLREQEGKLSLARSQHDELGQILENIAREIEKIFAESSACTAQADEIRRAISSFEEEAVRKEGEASVLKNDIRHHEENVIRIEREIEQALSSAQDLDAEIEERRLCISDKEEEITEKKDKLLKCAEQLESLRQGMDRFSGQMESLSGKLSELSMGLSEERVKALTAESSVKEIESRLSAVETGENERREQIASLEAEKKELADMLAEASERCESLGNAIKGYEIRLASRKQKQETIRQRVEKFVLDTEERKRRAGMLEEYERNLEGFTQSVKTVMKEASRGGLRGIHGPVSRLIQVPQEYTVAIETALGAATQNIVVGTEEDAKRAISFLKQRNAGRSTFLPLTIKGNPLKEQSLEDCPGFVGLASDLCACEEKYKSVLLFELGRIAVAEDLDSAVAIARRFSYRFRIVTLDGQVINAGGSMTGGSLARNSGLLGRASEIEGLKKEAEELAKKTENEKTLLKAAGEETSAAEAALLGARAELSQAQEDRIRIEAEDKNCAASLETVKKSAEELKNESAAARGRIKDLNAQKEQAEARAKEISAFIAQLEEKSTALSGNREELTKNREALTAQIQELRLSLIGAEKDIESLRGEIFGIESRKKDHTGRQEALLTEKDAVLSRNAMLSVQIDNLLNEAKGLHEKARQAEEQAEELARKRMEFEQKSVSLRQSERDKTAERETVGRELTRLEEQKMTLQKDYDDIISKLWEEYELTRREAEEIGQKIEHPFAAQKRLSELKNKIRALGSVNVGAIEEYKEVSGRYEFLKAQIGDVEKSREELLKLIGGLTGQMKELFLDRFKKIDKNFNATFRELFGGGTAELKLSNPEDVLGSGIDISVQPPGKIVTHLEALSGGEKALVAIALYFSIMKVSPAPFCVLDEIEAALDDVNVDRYAAYLRKMNENTQFIVITHRRGTMEEADVLYGVTMQDEGVSKLLELRASEIEQKLGMNR